MISEKGCLRDKKGERLEEYKLHHIHKRTGIRPERSHTLSGTQVKMHIKKPLETAISKGDREYLQMNYTTGGIKVRDMVYTQQKRLEVLETIKPICEAFGINDYDYEVNEVGQSEALRVGQTRIGCSLNSVSATIEELVGYIFIKTWRNRSIGAFNKQAKNVIKEYWYTEEDKLNG